MPSFYYILRLVAKLISVDNPGYLLAADRDGQPVVIAVQQFYQLAGVWIDPAECCGQFTEAGFEALYAQYLLWRIPTAEGHPLRQLCQEPTIK